jgi:thiol-disulfide isomerase/thioredoxin
MGSTKAISLILAIIVVGGIGWYGVSHYNSGDANDALMHQGDSMSGTDQMKTEGSGDTMTNEQDDAMIKDSTSTMEGDTMMKQSGTYEAYSLEKLALAKTGKVVLFFHADWCPTCRAIESEINAGTIKIPEGVHILKVDYDTAIALRQKYGVTVQHTFVQVDANGTASQKFSDAESLSKVLSRLK